MIIIEIMIKLVITVITVIMTIIISLWQVNTEKAELFSLD